MQKKLHAKADWKEVHIFSDIRISKLDFFFYQIGEYVLIYFDCVATHWHIASSYFNFLDTGQTVEYIYKEKRRTHALGLSLSRTDESYVKAPLTNKP